MNGINLEQQILELTNLFREYSQVVCVVLFGSYNTQFFNQNSDLDFGVVFDRPVDLFVELEIETKLSQILGTDRIDLVNLSKAPLILKYNAIAKGKIIYEADYQKTSDFIENVYAKYCDYEFDYRNLCADFDHSLRESYSG